ncbi:MAG: hypothetical protein MZU97_08800 [Bacillus subtilis]|nr:hypothetical protein [Bacillus subtilis]
MGGWRAGVSKAVGYGNAVDVDESDLYEYLLDDAATDVVVSYIESVGDGRKFIDRARKLDEKPLLILKAGKGSVGRDGRLFTHRPPCRQVRGLPVRPRAVRVERGSRF